MWNIEESQHESFESVRALFVICTRVTWECIRFYSQSEVGNFFICIINVVKCKSFWTE